MNLWHCDHESTQVREKTAENGTAMYGHMCLRCGGSVGKWLKKEIGEAESLGAWDNSIAKDWVHSRAKLSRERTMQIGALATKRDAHAEFADEQRQKWYQEYEAYLDSPAWRARRELVMKRAGGICEGCGINRATQVHHKTYIRTGREMLFDLVAICDECHNTVHGHVTAPALRVVER